MAIFIEIPLLISTDMSCHVQNFLDLAVILTCDLWPWKPFRQWPVSHGEYVCQVSLKSLH